MHLHLPTHSSIQYLRYTYVTYFIDTLNRVVQIQLLQYYLFIKTFIKFLT
jgi:hypothetical protein